MGLPLVLVKISGLKLAENAADGRTSEETTAIPTIASPPAAAPTFRSVRRETPSPLSSPRTANSETTSSNSASETSGGVPSSIDCQTKGSGNPQARAPDCVAVSRTTNSSSNFPAFQIRVSAWTSCPCRKPSVFMTPPESRTRIVKHDDCHLFPTRQDSSLCIMRPYHVSASRASPVGLIGNDASAVARPQRTGHGARGTRSSKALRGTPLRDPADRAQARRAGSSKQQDYHGVVLVAETGVRSRRR